MMLFVTMGELNLLNLKGFVKIVKIALRVFNKELKSEGRRRHGCSHGSLHRKC